MTYYKIKHNNTYVPAKKQKIVNEFVFFNLIDNRIISINAYPQFCQPIGFTEEIQKGLHLISKFHSKFIIYQNPSIPYSIVYSILHNEYYYFAYKSEISNDDFFKEFDLYKNQYICFKTFEELMLILLKNKELDNIDSFVKSVFESIYDYSSKH